MLLPLFWALRVRKKEPLISPLDQLLPQESQTLPASSKLSLNRSLSTRYDFLIPLLLPGIIQILLEIFLSLLSNESSLPLLPPEWINQLSWQKTLLLMLLVGITEELFFRKAPLDLLRALGVRDSLALLLSAVFFAIPHLYAGLLGVVYALGTGIGFGWYYLRAPENSDHPKRESFLLRFLKNRLVHLMLLHAAYNFVTLIWFE